MQYLTQPIYVFNYAHCLLWLLFVDECLWNRFFSLSSQFMAKVYFVSVLLRSSVHTRFHITCPMPLSILCTLEEIIFQIRH